MELSIFYEEVNRRHRDDLPVTELAPIEEAERSWRRSCYENCKKEIGRSLSSCGRAAQLLEIRAFGLAYDDGTPGRLLGQALTEVELRAIVHPTTDAIQNAALAGAAHSKLLQHRQNCPHCAVFPPPDPLHVRTSVAALDEN